jgi:ParB/RepB/Spo0J family partition protein
VALDGNFYQGDVMSAPTISRERELKWLPVDKIIKNENNPREETAFKPEELIALRRSMTTYGTLQPVIVAPYDVDMYRLIEGERRWTSAKLEGIKELPAVIVTRMNDQDEVKVMFQVHTQRKGWALPEELQAIRDLKEANGKISDEKLASELGMSLSTLRQRLQLLAMGDRVIAEVARGDLEYYAAVRADDLSKTLSRKRPDLVSELGGATKVRKRLLDKAKGRRGITREFESMRQDAGDIKIVPDAVIRTYVEEPATSLKDARQQAERLAERRGVEDLVGDINGLTRDLERFDPALLTAPNLRELRRAIVSLMDASQAIEEKIVAVELAG